MRPHRGKVAVTTGAPVRAQSAEVGPSRRGACWFARFKAVELSSVLMESYLYVAKHVSCRASVYIIVQLRLVFNRFFYFLEIFSERK